MNTETRESIILWFKIAGIHNRNILESNRILREYDITVAQFDVLAQLGKAQEMTQNALSEKLLATKGNISQLLRSMEEKGLVCRRQEWKTKFVTLTPQGAALHDKVVPLMESFQKETFQGLSPEERKTLLRLLRKVEPMKAHEGESPREEAAQE